MDNATIAGSTKAQTRATLAQYEEWHNQARDNNDAGSVYTMLASMESTVRASEINLGLEIA